MKEFSELYVPLYQLYTITLLFRNIITGFFLLKNIPFSTSES